MILYRLSCKDHKSQDQYPEMLLKSKYWFHNFEVIIGKQI